MTHPLADAHWLNPPTTLSVTAEEIVFETEAHTDFWQRTFYGFRASNAPAALIDVHENMTFTVRVWSAYRTRYDQAGILMWIDDDNWFKASIEFETTSSGRLGSVHTSHGYSDWATRDVGDVPCVWLRLSRRGPDFLFEAKTGQDWEQLRVFHVAALGPTDPDWAPRPPADVPSSRIRLGVYACSPESSTFTARFDRITLEPSTWAPHS